MARIVRKVKSVKYNWHQNGSTIDRDGAGEDWEKVTVGERGCVKIFEVEPTATTGVNYLVDFDDGSRIRIFNPNIVEYFPAEQLKNINEL